MRALLILLPALAMAQTPPTSTPAASTPPKAAAPAKKSPAAATTQATPRTAASPAAPKPAGAGRGAPGRGAAGRGASTAPKPAVAAPAPLTTDEQKTVYALGLMTGQSISMFNLTPAELELVKRALSDAAAGKPALELSEWGPKIQPLATSRSAAVAVKEKASSAAYLAKCAAEPGAVKTESGLVYREEKAGTGASPKATDTVKVHYSGTLVNGTEFDSSYKRGQPATFPVSGVIPGFTEALQLMKVGSKFELAIPPDLAYGSNGPLANQVLLFEVELLSAASATETPNAK